MKKIISELVANSDKSREIAYPAFYRLSKKSDKKAFEKLITENKKLVVRDEIHGQIEELIKHDNPKTVFNAKDLKKAAEAFLKEKKAHEYGVWVYYPWSNRLIHILDEKEFIAVRTSRNQYKITPDEQVTLRTKKIGVIGLSVGQSVALTMAQERIFGEIRLADFDVLELSNYNRIRTGLYNLGTSKVVSVAREIAEIDPFLKVTCYTTGINEDNIDDFLLKNGKLDICIDECDGLYIKILCRQKAKEYGIPVVMEASDRGTVDVERFDLEPNRSILHGFIDHLDLSKVKEAKTNEEKVPFALPMLGLNTMSNRMKASMLEIEQSITTWPQLASAVTLGGGITTDVCRRIALGYYKESGRYHVDVEEIISDKKPELKNKTVDSLPKMNYEALDAGKMSQLANKLLSADNNRSSLILTEKQVRNFVKQASLAPSGANNQPWKWFFMDTMLFLFHDKSISTSFVDFEWGAAYVSLGATLETLLLALNSEKIGATIQYFPLAKHEELIAAISFAEDEKVVNKNDVDLLSFISKRCTNRKVTPVQSIKTSVLNKMIDEVKKVDGANLQFIKNRAQINVLKEIIIASERLRFMHPEGGKEFFEKEIRWTEKENEIKRDGIDVETLELSLSERAGLEIAKNEDVINLLRNWKKGKGFEKITGKAIDAATAIGLITMPKRDPMNYLNGGRSVQRMWLEATKNQLSIHPITGPLFLFPRLTIGKGEGMTEAMIDELPVLRKKFTKIFDLDKDKGEVFLFRVCIAGEPEKRSLRKHIDDILFFGTS